MFQRIFRSKRSTAEIPQWDGDMYASVLSANEKLDRRIFRRKLLGRMAETVGSGFRYAKKYPLEIAFWAAAIFLVVAVASREALSVPSIPPAHRAIQNEWARVKASCLEDKGSKECEYIRADATAELQK